VWGVRCGHTGGVTAEAEVLEADWEGMAAVVARMDDLATRQAGWVNLQPGIAPEDAPRADAGLFGLFSGRGPVVPVATWTAPAPRRRGPPEPEQVGIQHPAGGRAAGLLADAGLGVPAGWRVVQDHPRRGLVVAVPPGTAHDEVLDWLLRATAHLSAVPVTGRWRATVHRG
jgi:hypothetical protein